jgi:hypothetical protein
MHSKGLWIAAAVLAGFALVVPMASAASRDTGNGGGPAIISAAFFEDFVATREAVRLWADQHATAALEKARGNERNDKSEKVKAEPAETTTQQTEREEDPADEPEAVNLRPVSTPLSLTGSARPGWGCGDDKHEHTGPPGRTDPTSPCDKNKP